MQEPPHQEHPQQQGQQYTSWGSSPQWQQNEPLPPQYPQQMSPPQPPWQQPLPPQHQWYAQPPQPYSPYAQQQPQWGQQLPPPSGQPFYGQPPYGVSPSPYYRQPQQPKKGSRRWLWITLGVIGGIVVLLCAGSSIIAALGIGTFARLAGPDIAAQDYYDAIERQDYTKAYTYLDSHATFIVNGQPVPLTQPDAFTTEATTLDSTLGAVSYFHASISGNGYSSIDVTVRRSGSSYLVHLQLAQVGNQWKIASADGI